MKTLKEIREAVSPAQQAAIAIAKKEKGIKEYGGPKISRAAYLKKGKEYHKQEAVDADDKGEYDNEGEMAKTQLRGVVADASHMIKMFSDDQNLPEWVQSKITKAADYLKSAHSYMMNKDDDDTEGAVRETNKIHKKELGNLHKKEEVDPADVDDYEASDDDRKAADKNIVMQIRRAADLPKGSEIHFKDGKKFKMNQKTAKMIVKKFNAMRKPSDKEAFQNKASQSLAGLRSSLGLK